MNRIEELIQQLCPDGVEFKSLGDVAALKRGTTITAKSKTDGSIPVISGGQKPAYYNGKSNRDGETITVAGSGAYAGYVMYWNEPIFVSDAFSIKVDVSKVLSRYIYHFLLNIQDKIHDLKAGGGVPHVYAKDVARFSIPIPPLAIQNEIVNILDLFTRLEAELEAELEARKMQYTYYRDALLNFEGKGVEWKTLGEIGEFTRGKRFVKTDITSEGVPCIHYGEMYTHYKIWAKEAKSFLDPSVAVRLRAAKYGDVIIVAAGETIKDIGQGVAWLGENDIIIHDACFAFSHSLHPNYVSHFLQTDIFHSQIKRHISSGKISSINAAGLSKAKIPVPSMEEQRRIANILDKFDALVNDLSSGLPAEIKARRQQYEYYRDQLLTFKNRDHG